MVPARLRREVHVSHGRGVAVGNTCKVPYSPWSVNLYLYLSGRLCKRPAPQNVSWLRRVDPSHKGFSNPPHIRQKMETAQQIESFRSRQRRWRNAVSDHETVLYRARFLLVCLPAMGRQVRWPRPSLRDARSLSSHGDLMLMPAACKSYRSNKTAGPTVRMGRRIRHASHAP